MRNEQNICGRTDEKYKNTVSERAQQAELLAKEGIISELKQNPKEAIGFLKKVIELEPQNFAYYGEIAHLLLTIEDFEESIKYCEKTLELNPKSAKAYNIMGIGYKAQKNIKNALQCFEKAIELEPNFVKAHYNWATTQLLNGNSKEGLKEYEWRFKIEDGAYPLLKINKPMWNGEDLTDKTILICWEQGLGDTIQFSRYLTLLNEKAKKVIVKVQDPLYKLLSRNYSNIEFTEVNEIEALPEFDTYCYFMSLPYIFNTDSNTIPYSEGYIKAYSQIVIDYKKKYFNNNNIKIGIKWHGNPQGEKCRQVPLEAFYMLADIPNIKLYSLQTDSGIEELKNTAEDLQITPLGNTFNDFEDTAAAIENLDIIISNDSSIVHLAGAMNKPTWVLLNYIPEQRWRLDSETTNWYDSLKLFRTNRDRDWFELMNRVKSELVKFTF